jgi:DNA-binding PadR family transcriptional regulator
VEDGVSLTPEQKLSYAQIYLLKKMDLKPQDGGMPIPILLPPELAPLEDALQELVNEDLIALNRKKGIYEITKKGYARIAELIEEAEALIDEFDDRELQEAVAELRARRLDVFRARFLWGWYDGELDDLVTFQERRGIAPVERMWAYYLTSDEFFDTLAEDTGE